MKNESRKEKDNMISAAREQQAIDTAKAYPELNLLPSIEMVKDWFIRNPSAENFESMIWIMRVYQEQKNNSK